jgi:hypothetical protein
MEAGTRRSLCTDSRLFGDGARWSSSRRFWLVLLTLAGVFGPAGIASAAGGRVVVPPNTRVLAASKVLAAPAPGKNGTLIYAGSSSFRAGQVVAVGIGKHTPDGFLGRVVNVFAGHGQTAIETRPATLEQAVTTGSFDKTFSTARDQAAFNRSLSAKLHRVAAAQMTCSGSAQARLSTSLKLGTSINFQAAWSASRASRASLTETSESSAALGVTVGSVANCEFKSASMQVSGPSDAFSVRGVPVVITSTISISVDGSASMNGALTTGLSADLSAKAGAGWRQGRGLHPIDSISSKLANSATTVNSDATADATLTEQLILHVDGVAGPEVDLSTGLAFTADTTQNPWWTLSAPVSAHATLNVPALGLSTPRRALYGHAFELANAGGSFAATGGAPTPTLPFPVVPATGPTLIDQEDTAAYPATGDQTFSDWSHATGQAAAVEASLPTSLSGYRCVVLDLNQSFASGDEGQLAAFLDAGGTVLALGERSDAGGQLDQADGAINGLLGALDSGLSLNQDAIDEGDTVTSNIDAAQLTDGVTSLGYNWTDTVGISPAATQLIATEDDSATLIGGATVGRGLVVLSGDSNAFSDNNDGFYSDYGNGQLVKNLCP